MCKSFYARLVRQTGLNVTDNVQKCSIIHKHVYSIVRAEKSEKHPISLVHSSSDGDQLCSDLITSAFMDMIPSPGVCFCPCDTGVALRGYVRRLKCNPSDREQYLKQLKNSFTLNASCDEDVAIHTVLVPVLISGNHWGVLLGKKYIGSSRYLREKPTVYFGDSLGYECPSEVLEFFREAFEFAILNGSCGAVVSNKNYLLAVRGYKRQRDGLSCGCYVISMATEFAADTGFSPKATYKSGYKKMLSERICWAAIKSRMLQVLSAAVFHGTDEVSESMLGSYRLLHRDHYSELRKDGLTRLKKMRHTILKRWDFLGISKVHSAQKGRDRNREVAKTSSLVGEACDLVKDVLSKENAGPECVSVDDGGSFEEHSVSDSEKGNGS
ncbi:Papain-like cysteine peptidase [Gracilaria domingensis]|nr:Papain-like cysteine peptidase [Gracilaria domingensis]